jgi:hypothetical protein
MTDDLSKWRLGAMVPVPYREWPQQEVRVVGQNSESVNLKFFDPATNAKSLAMVLSLDDAENFATLILYEVKRAKGEL